MEAGDQELLDHLVAELIDAPMSDWPFSYRNGSTMDAEFASGPSAVASISEKHLARLSRAVDLRNTDLVDERWQTDSANISLSRFGHVLVDMNATDGDIEKAFIQWLSGYRHAVNPEGVKKLNRMNLSDGIADWNQSRLFPYFDLVVWCKWSKTPLTEIDLLALLFPEDPAAPREALRTLGRKSKRVFKMSNVLSLLLQFRTDED